MPTIEAAREIILRHVAPLEAERVPLLDALGRVSAEDMLAPWDLPQWDNSAMDGFAVRAADCADTPVTLKITGYIPAGGLPTTAVDAGCAINIMTGAPVPTGCDAVVPVEETTVGDGVVVILQRVKKGQHIRFRGEDVASGTVTIAKGTRIRPAEISLLASMGRALAPVYRKPRVGILSTGDELVELGEAPGPGQIINSNTLSLAAAVREAGGEAVILGIARDDRQSHLEKIAAGLACDALITSAGVSAGDRDLVRDVLAEMGVEQLFWKVDMKPGGPTAFGVKGSRPVFSLPGNPVSTMVTFELFVRPALLRMQGQRRVIPVPARGVLAEDMTKKPGKVNLVRVRLSREGGSYRCYSAGVQQTGLLTTMVRSDGLAILPADATFLPAGTEVGVLPMGTDADMVEE